MHVEKIGDLTLDKFELSLAKVSKFAQLYVDRSSLNESVIILWWMGFH